MNINNKKVQSIIHGKKTILSDVTIQELFHYAAARNGRKTAVYSDRDIEAEEFAKENSQETPAEKLQYCLNKNRYTICRELENYKYLYRSKSNQVIIVNQQGKNLMEMFNGELALWEVFREISGEAENISCTAVEPEEPYYRLSDNNCHVRININDTGQLLSFTQFLYTHQFLHICKQRYENISDNEIKIYGGEIQKQPISDPVVPVRNKKGIAKILLIGDKPGAPGVGILYLASYLIKNGLSVRCLFNNIFWNNQTLESEIIKLVETVCPEYVGISMKWFPHIQRVYDVAEIIKKWNPKIKIIVGGDTASYYKSEVIQHECIDYVIHGDGEDAILDICKGNKVISNCIYKSGSQIITDGPVSSNNENSRHCLLPLEKYVMDVESVLFSTLYIPTEKGCQYDCVQCGGNVNIQKQVFHREKTLYLRNPDLIRKDLKATMNYVTTYMFSLNSLSEQSVDYCKKMWGKVSLQNHYCALFSINIIKDEIVDLACKTFKYVRFSVDISSLSQRHRDEVNKSIKCKRQPDDSAILKFFRTCEQYDNCAVDLYTIAGMPLYESEDMERENILLDKLLKFRSFNSLQWGKLHAQPGAGLSENAGEYSMITAAGNYDEFLHYSSQNTADKSYPSMSNYHFPYITYKNAHKNSEILMHYMDMSYRVMTHARRKKVAIEEEISYESMDYYSNVLADKLRGNGVRPGDTVFIQVNNRIFLALGIIGVIKTGAVYIPVSEGFQGNLAVQAKALMGESYLVDHKLVWESLYEKQGMPENNLRTDTFSNTDMLYRIFSSGTTGIPKFIAVAQIGIINYILFRNQEYYICDKDKILELLPESFDGFGANFYSAVLSGAALIMPSKERQRDYNYVRKLIKKYGITHTSLIPDMYELLMEYSDNRLESLRTVVLAGEAATRECVARSRLLYPATRLVNEYGPSENSIGATYQMPMDESEMGIIGRPIANVTILLCDEDHQVVPQGNEGEICITGIGLFKGYYPEETYPWEYTKEGEKVYRTGDIGIMREDGRITYLGRKDRQVKIRGMLVHPEAVENSLRGINGVTDAIVKKNNSSLVAYVVLRENVTVNMIKTALSRQLASYMLPSRFIQLKSIERLDSGKVDYQKLPGQELSNVGQTEPEYTQMQIFLLEIWKKKLSNEQVSLDDNLFELGGNSLIVMKVFEKINEVYPNKINITDLFSYHTVASLADYMETKAK